MYRRRRLVALLAALALVAAVVLAIWQPWRGALQPGGALGPSPSGTSASVSATPPVAKPTKSTSASPTRSASPSPSGSSSATPIAACSTSEITVLAVTDKDSYGAGEKPKLSITLSNKASHPCLINVGTATQSFEITSGSDTWWRSTDCQSESSDQVVQLAAGQTVSSVQPIEWDRTRSSVDTCTKKRPSAPAGYFHLQVSIGGIEGADTTMFRLR